MTTAASEIDAAMALQKSGKWAAAEHAYRQWIERHGANPGVEHMLALSLHAQGRSEESLPWFERAANTTAGTAAVLWNNFAAALLAVGNSTDAGKYARKAVQAEPGRAGAWLNLGLACEIQHDFAAASKALETSLQILPSQPSAIRALARCQLRLGEADAALAVLTAIAPGTDKAADLVRCEAWIAVKDYSSAAAFLNNLIGDSEVATDAQLLKAQLAIKRGQGNKALELLEDVIRIDPDNRAATVRSALINLSRADTSLGLSRLRSWLDRHPEDQSTASSYLVACNYSEYFDPERLLAEHQQLRPPPLAVKPWPIGWTQQHPSAPLRVAWVSSAFSVGPIEIFFSEVLQSLLANPARIEHRLYAIGGESTNAPAAASWAVNQIDVSGLSDEQLVEKIRADGIDIAIDMVGRAAGNRLGVFAARVAPVQVGWLDVFNPSGIATMDYLITDEKLSPPGADAHFTERLIRLPHGRLAYRPPPVESASLDGVRSRKFICLNRFSKLNDAVLDVWAKILQSLPDWTLDLKAKGGADADLIERFRSRFEERGVDRNRVRFTDAGPYAEAMDAYQTAAIALDPFPFSGCSTTCDALWMGLPVVTLPRETIASRQSAALLEFCGLSEWVAKDEDSYLSIAIELARNVQRRHEWRAGARGRMRAALCDSKRLACELLDAFNRIAQRATEK